jgi:hypothetical protein
MKASIQWSREVPVRYEADVAVVGGGMAGVCAACAAAREGASVILVERFAVTGGNATVGGVANWSGETRGQGAIFDEIIAMQEEFGAIAPYPGAYEHFSRMNRVFDHEVLAVILQELLLRYGVKLLLHTRFVDVSVDDSGRIGEAIVCGMSGPEALRARVLVDCTGEACVARAAGFSTEKGDGKTLTPPGQLPPSLMYFLRERPEPVSPQLPEGWFEPVTREEDLPMTSVWPDGPGGKAIKLKIPGYDSTDTESMTALEVRARRRMFEVLDYFQRFKKNPWRLGHCSPIIGLREGARIAGDYVLTVDDVRAGREFEDAVARGVFFLDGMTPRDEKRTYILTHEEQVVPPYQIPLRSLIARDGRNLLMAGRCFSADQHALSSARVMTTCAMMGQAVGVLAALAVAGGADPRSIDPVAVRRVVEAQGANLAV